MPTERDPVASTEFEQTGPMAGNGRKRVILIVDDHAVVRAGFRQLIDATDDLEVGGEAGTAAAALSLAAANRFDGVMLDISLPEMDGTEVLAWIRGQADLKDTPVIALTAHAMSGDREKYLRAGFDDYVTKPIVEEALRSIPGPPHIEPPRCPGQTSVVSGSERSFSCSE